MKLIQYFNRTRHSAIDGGHHLVSPRVEGVTLCASNIKSQIRQIRIDLDMELVMDAKMLCR